MEAYNREIRFNGVPIRVIENCSTNIWLFFITFVKNWITQPYADVSKQRYVLPKLYAASGRVDVELYRSGKQPECAYLVEKLTEEEFEELLVAEDLTAKQFAVICDVALCEKYRMELYYSILSRRELFNFPELSEDAYFGYMAHIFKMLYHGGGRRYYNRGDFDFILTNDIIKLCLANCGYDDDDKDGKEKHISNLSENEFCDRSNRNNPGMRYLMAYKSVFEAHSAELSPIGEMLRADVEYYKTIIQLFY
jgi:hypothetical protein